MPCPAVTCSAYRYDGETKTTIFLPTATRSLCQVLSELGRRFVIEQCGHGWCSNASDRLPLGLSEERIILTRAPMPRYATCRLPFPERQMSCADDASFDVEKEARVATMFAHRTAVGRRYILVILKNTRYGDCHSSDKRSGHVKG